MTDEVTIESLTAQLAASNLSLDAANVSVGKLEGKNQELLGEKKTAFTQAQAAEAAQALAVEEAARKSGSFEDMDNSHIEKYTKLLKVVEERDAQISGLTSGAKSLKMAAELAVEGSAEELHILIKSRFSTVITDGAAKTVILDADGKLSALTYEELKTELSAKRGLAPLISGSKASGSGAVGGKNGGGAVKLGDMTLTERSRLANENPEQYAQLIKSH